MTGWLDGLTAARDEPGEIRAALLTRLSQFRENSTSLERQRHDGMERIAAAGWSFDPQTDIFEDVESGWNQTKRRPGLERLLGNLDKYDVIVFWKLDRAFRSMQGFLDFLRRCERSRVGLVSVKEDLDTTTPVGRLVAYILMAIAEMESENISLRSRAGNDFIVKNGGYRGGLPPFGWRPEVIGHLGSRQQRRLALDPERAPLVRIMVDQILRGSAINEVARKMNEDYDIGREWTAGSVGRLLRNPILIGRMVHRKQLVVDDYGIPVAPNEPLIDLLTWTRLQSILDDRSRLGGKGISRRDSLLRGVIRCGRCGSTMRGPGPAGKGCYACSRHYRNSKLCPGNAMRAENLHRVVVESVFERLTPDVIAQAHEALEAERIRIASPDPTEVRLTELRTTLDLLEEDRQAGIYSGAEGARRFRRQHTRLLREIERLLANTDAARAAAIPDFSPLRGMPLRDVWSLLEIREQQTVLRGVIDTIVIHPTVVEPGKKSTGRKFDPGRIEIRWRDDLITSGASRPIAGAITTPEVTEVCSRIQAAAGVTAT